MDIKAYIESGIIESYVMRLTSPEETAEVESMMAGYPEIAQAVSDFEIRLEENLLANAVIPEPSVKQKILSAIQNGNSPVATEEYHKVIPFKKASPAWKYLAAASIILLLLSTTFNVYYYNKYADAQNSYNGLLAERSSLLANLDATNTRLNIMDSSMQMIKDTAMIVVAMKGKNNMSTVYWDSRTKDVYVLQNEMPKAPKGKQFQLWAIVDGKPVDAGMIGDCVMMCKMKNIPRAEAFAITLEDEGGSPSPHMDQLYVIGKI